MSEKQNFQNYLLTYGIQIKILFTKIMSFLLYVENIQKMASHENHIDTSFNDNYL